MKAKDRLCPDILDTSVNVQGLLGALPSLWVPSFCSQFPERIVACGIRTTPALSHRGQSSQSRLASPLRASFRSVILPILGGVPYFEAHCNMTNGNLREGVNRNHHLLEGGYEIHTYMTSFNITPMGDVANVTQVRL